MELVLCVLHVIEELIMSRMLLVCCGAYERHSEHVYSLQIAQSYYLQPRIHPNTYHAYIH